MDDPTLAQQEVWIARLVWVVSLATIALTLGLATAAGFLLAKEVWHYLIIAMLAASPALLGMPASLCLHLRHVSLLRRDQARLVIRMKELQELASRDGLTGLYNRRYFYHCLEQELEKARITRQPLALLLLDIDSLKAINDEYGHVVGDAVIANLAQVIAKHTRSTDTPARLGGDEFGVIMRNTDKRGAFALARRLWQELECTPMYEEGGVRIMVNVSIGVSGYPWGGEDVDEMMHWADVDMYTNKVSRKLPTEPVTSSPEQPPVTDDLTDFLA